MRLRLRDADLRVGQVVALGRPVDADVAALVLTLLRAGRRDPAEAVPQLNVVRAGEDLLDRAPGDASLACDPRPVDRVLLLRQQHDRAPDGERALDAVERPGARPRAVSLLGQLRSLDEELSLRQRHRNGGGEHQDGESHQDPAVSLRICPSFASVDGSRWRRYERGWPRETRRATVLAACPHGSAVVASTDAGARACVRGSAVSPTVLIVDDHAEFRASASGNCSGQRASTSSEWRAMAGPLSSLCCACGRRSCYWMCSFPIGTASRSPNGWPRMCGAAGRPGSPAGMPWPTVAGWPAPRCCGFIAKRDLSGAAIAALVS